MKPSVPILLSLNGGFVDTGGDLALQDRGSESGVHRGSRSVRQLGGLNVVAREPAKKSLPATPTAGFRMMATSPTGCKRTSLRACTKASRQHSCRFPFLKLQDVFDDAVGELAFRGCV
jgi:hypothetical protein